MNIDTPDTTFTLAVYVRDHTLGDYDIHITNEQTSKTTIKTMSGTYSDGLLTLTDIGYQIGEGKSYWIKIYCEGVEVYKGKLFCTSQTNFDDFDTLNDYYSVITKDENPFIVKE